MEKYQVGDTIKPFPGGDMHGRCRRCEREGLQIVAVPIPAANKPKGWAKLPTE